MVKTKDGDHVKRGTDGKVKIIRGKASDHKAAKSKNKAKSSRPKHPQEDDDISIFAVQDSEEDAHNERDNEETEEIIRSLEEALKLANSRITGLAGQLKTVQQHAIHFKGEFDKAQLGCKKFADEAHSLREDLDDTREELEDKEDELRKKDHKLEKLLEKKEDDFRRVESKLASSEHKVRDVEREVDKVKLQNAELTLELQKQQRRQDRNELLLKEDIRKLQNENRILERQVELFDEAQRRRPADNEMPQPRRGFRNEQYNPFDLPRRPYDRQDDGPRYGRGF